MRLSDDERATLVNIASTLVEPSKTSAIGAYGSKVAGYCRPDSDYDLIIVSKRFREGIRYKYIDSPVAASALIVDEHMFEAGRSLVVPGGVRRGAPAQRL